MDSVLTVLWIFFFSSISSGKDTYCADCGNTCVFHGFVPDNEMDVGAGVFFYA